MKRELFLIHNFYRLDELLAHSNDASGAENGPLAVGFYKTKRAVLPATGIEILVTPHFLRPHILTLIEDGQFSPLESGFFLWAGPDAGADLPWKLSRPENIKQSPLSRWLLLGLNSSGIGNNRMQSASEPLSAVEHVREFLNALFKNILELRPNMVVFLFDIQAISYHLTQHGISATEASIFDEVFSWLVEDCLHPKLAIVFKSENDFRRASQSAHSMVALQNIARDVEFGF